MLLLMELNSFPSIPISSAASSVTLTLRFPWLKIFMLSAMFCTGSATVLVIKSDRQIMMPMLTRQITAARIPIPANDRTSSW